jgi:hypothetical protein
MMAMTSRPFPLKDRRNTLGVAIAREKLLLLLRLPPPLLEGNLRQRLIIAFHYPKVMMIVMTTRPFPLKEQRNPLGEVNA